MDNIKTAVYIGSAILGLVLAVALAILGWRIVKVSIGPVGVEFEPPPPREEPNSSSATHTAVPSSCLFQAETELETFRKMLQAESRALLEGDVELFAQIHSADVEVVDVSSGTKYDLYKWERQIFDMQEWIELEHYDVRIARAVGDKAWVVNSARGAYIDVSNDRTIEFDSRDSDHRIFVKNEDGCWVVKHLEVNAADKPFP